MMNAPHFLSCAYHSRMFSGSGVARINGGGFCAKMDEQQLDELYWLAFISSLSPQKNFTSHPHTYTCPHTYSLIHPRSFLPCTFCITLYVSCLSDLLVLFLQSGCVSFRHRDACVSHRIQLMTYLVHDDLSSQNELPYANSTCLVVLSAFDSFRIPRL